MNIKLYDRERAVIYAKKWAFSRNKRYYNFDNIGGDCTNFVSQCIYAGCKIMNYSKSNGWCYNSLNDRSPSWTGVEPFYNFLITNKYIGPFGTSVSESQIKVGDVIQLGKFNATYHHTMIVTKITNSNIFTSSHTIDSLDRPLSSYKFDKIRFLHIKGVRI